MKLARLCILVAGASSAAGSLVSCDPCSQRCSVPCNTPNPSLPMVWDNENEKPEAVITHGQFNLNPYNTQRPQYRDAPPSQFDLEKIWQHHLRDHAYKSPYVRPLKSGLWEAGVPNRYSPDGYNRRAFPLEKDALSYLRHKTGAGSDISQDEESSLLEVASKKSAEDSEMVEVSEFSDDAAPALIELFSATKETTPTSDIDINEMEASPRSLRDDDLVLSDDDKHVRAARDHNLKIAHKMRDMLANYRPDHEVEVLFHGAKSL